MLYDRVIFIDNGSTGTIGCVSSYEPMFEHTPTISEQDYTKRRKNVTRLDVTRFTELLVRMLDGRASSRTMVVMERPMINPQRFATSISAARVCEAELVAIELLGLPHMFVDSKDWQRGLLPSSGHKGTTSANLKKESADIGSRMYPQFKDMIRKHGDADGILGAYAMYRRLNMGA